MLDKGYTIDTYPKLAVGVYMGVCTFIWVAAHVYALRLEDLK